MAEMTDSELIGYVDLHSRTERALFHSDHLNRFFDLAGHHHPHLEGWYAFHYDEFVKGLVEKAYKRLRLKGVHLKLVKDANGQETK